MPIRRLSRCLRHDRRGWRRSTIPGLSKDAGGRASPHPKAIAATYAAPETTTTLRAGIVIAATPHHTQPSRSRLSTSFFIVGAQGVDIRDQPEQAGASRRADFEYLAVVAGLKGNTKLTAAVELRHDRHHG